MKNPFKDLIFMFFLLIFILLLVYISSFAYQKKYLPLTLSKFQYSRYKSLEDIPEGLDALSYASELDQCPPGQCAIQKVSGLKRCPKNVTSKLVYNTSNEVCTRPNFCDYNILPYAVKSDGSATDGICETTPDGDKVPCRCTKNKTCSDYQLSKFTIVGGDPGKTGDQNFKIIQQPFYNQGEIGFSSITIDNSSTEFCEINPGFTGILEHGCNLGNASADKLGCQTISTVVLSGAGTPLSWKLDTIKGQTAVLRTFATTTTGVDMPNSGLLNFTGTGDPPTSGNNVPTEIISYKGITDQNTDTGANTKYITINNIVSVSYTVKGDPNIQGFPGHGGFQYPNWNVQSTAGASPAISFATSSLDFCTVPNTVANYKNMLLCTQADNNVCKFGTFTYNFDKLNGIKDNTIIKTDETFTRNFCQLNINRNLLQRDNYLEDPEYYTLSCAIGSGCDGKGFQSTNSGDINKEAIGKYFPEVDINGINGVWKLKNVTGFPNISFDNFGTLLNNATIQAGDFWSINVVNQNLVSGPSGYLAGTSIIKVQDLFGLGPYVNTNLGSVNTLKPIIYIGGTSYILMKAEYNVINNKNASFIVLNKGIKDNLNGYAVIRVRPPVMKSDQTYGIVTTDKRSETTPFVFMTLMGSPIPNFSPSLDITIYKQFSFSGPNYVTKVMNNPPYGPVGSYRVYTRGSGAGYTYPVQPAAPTAPYNAPLLPPEDIYQLNFSSAKERTGANLNFSSPQAPFKIPLSMYYPVWNPVLYQQECVRCKPFLLTSVEINNVNNLSNVLIQFSGKDFGNYEYNAASTSNNKYCYVSTSEINFSNTEQVTNTTQRIMLKEPNLNVNVGDYILDSTLQMQCKIVLEDGAGVGGASLTGRYSSLFVVPQIFPSGDAIDYFSKNCLQNAGIDVNGFLKGSNFGEPITSNPFTISFGVDESTSENFVYKSDSGTDTLFANQMVTLTYSNASGAWKVTPNTAKAEPGQTDNNRYPNNYFFGKKYQSLYYYKTKMVPSAKKVYTEGFYFIPLQKVTSISSDRKTIITDSLFPKEIEQRFTNNDKSKPEKTYVQFCRLDSPLKLDVTSENGTPIPSEEVVINAISDSRITDIIITSTKQKFLKENPPIIKINTENQNFL